MHGDQEPFFIVLDIDGTIIGDISLQVCEWEILSKFHPKKLRQLRQSLIQQLQQGMLRSGLSDFLSAVKKENEHTEFLVYTASEEKWAQFLIPCIEAACGYKFGRPIFTRKDCVHVTRNITKSLSKISSKIIKSYKSKYPAIRSSKSVVKNMIMIDNNNLLCSKECNRCIECPTYSFLYPYNVLQHVDEGIIIKNYPTIANILERYDMFPSSQHVDSLGYFGMMSAYYGQLARVMKTKASSVKHKKDNMWYSIGNDMVAAMKKDLTKENMVKYINQRLAHVNK